MTVNVSNTELNNSFNSWRLNTNYLATIMSNNVVTVARAGSANRGGVATGNGHIKGTFSAVEFRTNTLKGGNTSSLTGGTITVASNTIIDPQTFTVNANTTFNANVTFNTSGAETLTLGDISRVRVTGGTQGQFLRIDTNSNTPAFKSLTLRDITDLSSNSAHLILSGANTSFGEALDSTHLRFTGGNGNGDAIEIFLAGDALLGDSDLFLQLADVAGDSKLVITDSANTIVASVDSTGNVIAQGTLHVDGAVDFESTLDVVGKTTLGQLHANAAVDFDTTLNVDGATTLNGLTTTTITANGAVDLNSTLNVDGATTLNGLTTTTITANGAVDLNSTLNVDGATTLNGLTATTVTANGAVDLNSTLNVDGATTLNGLTTTTITANGAVDLNSTLNVDGATTLNGNITLGDAQGDTITVKGKFANQATTGAATFGGASIFNGITTFNNTVNLNGDVNLGDAAADSLVITSTTTLGSNATIGDSDADTLTINSRIMSHMIANGAYDLGSSANEWRKLYVEEADIDGALTNDGTVIISANGKLHANNTVTTDSILNTMIQNDHIEFKTNGSGSNIDVGLGQLLNINEGEGIDITISSNTITFASEDASTTNKGAASFATADFNVTAGAVEIKDSFLRTVTTDSGSYSPNTHTLTMLGGEGIDVTHTAGSISIVGEDASAANKGVAKFDSGDFDVTAGNVVLKDAVTGAVLGINGTANEVSVSRSNGTVTVGLPSTLNLGANASTVSIAGTLNANAHSQILGTDRSALSEANRHLMWVNGGLSSLDVYANTVFHDSVAIPGGVVSTGEGNFNSLVVQNQTYLRGDVELGNASGDLISFDGQVSTAIVPNADSVRDLGSTTNAWRNLYVDDVRTTANVHIAGNLIVSGTTTTINTATLDVADNQITLNSDLSALTAPTENSGIKVNRGSSANVDIRWNETADIWELTEDGANYDRILTDDGTTISARTDLSTSVDSGDFLLILDASDTGKLKKATINNAALQGQKGEKGQKGQKGEVGATGAAGAKGDKGEVGATGAAGAKGQKGEVGATGAAGAKGQKGEVGATGAAGAKGDKGEVGVKGDKGQKGEAGVNGVNGAKGDKGQKGEIGAKGITGDKGQKGEIGVKGITGDKGQKGEIGAKGITGDKGQKGEVGVTGAKGDKGQKGQKGEQGVIALTDPNADRIVFWDESVNAFAFMSPVTTGIRISGTTIDSEYANSLNFNTGNGILTIGRNIGTDLTVAMDGRYIIGGGNLFVLEDEDGTEVTISNGNEVKMIGGNYININWTDTSPGSDGDPYDLTFTHENTTRSDLTTTSSPAHGGTFTAVSGVATNPEGHVTSVTTKTVTLPADNNTTYTAGTGMSLVGTTFNCTVTDTNTTYSAGSGLDLSGTTFSVEADLRGDVSYVGFNSSNYMSFASQYITDIVFNGLTEFRFESDGDFHADGDITAFSNATSSDAKLKTNIKTVENALDKVCQLDGVTFEWIRDGKESAGVIAQNVETVLPRAVKEVEDLNGDDTHKVVDYNQLSALFIEAIKELKAENAELRKMIEEGNK